MDCRKPLVVVLGLLVGVAGCTTTLPGVRPDTATQLVGEDGGVIHKAPTYVAFGDFRAKSAQSTEHTPAQRQQFREEARLSYLKAIEVDPKYVPGYVALARFQQACEDHGSAVAVYQKALNLAPRDAALWFELGMCQCRARDWTAALASMRKAAELEPANRKYATIAGYALARAGQWEEAYGVLSRVNGAARAHYDLARMLAHVQKADDARQHAQAALAMDPNLNGARDLLSELDGKSPSGLTIETVNYSAPAAPEARAPSPIVQTAATDDPPLPRIITPNSLAIEQNGTSSDAPRIVGGEGVGRPIRLPPLPVISIRSKSE